MDELFFFLPLTAALALAALCALLLYRRRTQRRQLAEITRQIEQILTTGSDEKVLLLTDDPSLTALLIQIDRLLKDRQKVRVDYRRSEQSARRMLSNISHDLKTPLTVILGYLEIARLRGVCDGETLQKIEEKSRQLMELIEKFFTLSKLEAGDTELPLQRADLCELCREVAVDFFAILTEQSFQVSMDIPEEPLYVYGNESAIRRILGNLISNAIRYGGEGKYLRVAVRATAQTVCAIVTDRGRGIEKSQLPNVFDRLYTLDDSRSHALGGSGLGLAIARQLAGQMNGTLTAESAGGETTFTLTLPRLRPAENERNS